MVNLLFYQLIFLLRFVMKYIEFTNSGNTIVNPSRANCYCSFLKFRKVSPEYATSPNKFLTYSGQPALCVQFVLVNGCNLQIARSYGSNPVYEVKDVRVRFPRHELERMSGFFGYLSQANTVYYNGMSVPSACINIGTRFIVSGDTDGTIYCFFLF